MLSAMQVPRFLRVAEVAFPLEVTPQGVRIAMAVPALEPLQLVLAALCNPSVSASERACFAQGRDFIAPELAAVRTTAASSDARAGVASWHELARGAAALAPATELYLFTAGFSRHALAVPRPIAAALCAELVALSEAVRAGQVRAELAPPSPDDPLLAGGPLTETLDEEWDDDDDDLEPEPAREVTHAAPSTRASTSPAGAPSDDILRELEDAAAMLDGLDPDETLRPALPPEELDALTSARRQTLLLGLATAGLLSESSDDAELRHRLAAAGMPTLVGYLDAAARLRAYHLSSERTRLVGAPPTDLLAGAVSLDYFRLDSPPGPPGIAAHDWLALCEAAFLHAHPKGARATRTYVRLEGRGVWLCARAELGAQTRLWRVVPASR